MQNNASMDRAGDIYDSMEQPQAAHSEVLEQIKNNAELSQYD